MFRKKRLPLSRREKITRAIYIELAILGALMIVIWSHSFDLMVAGATPEIRETEVYSPVKNEELSIKEHICSATNGQNCEVLYNLCQKESGKFDQSKEEKCQQYAVNKNNDGTYDHSWYQINDVHIIGRPASKGRGTITMECVYDLYCVSRWANQRLIEGNGHWWVAWHSI